MVKDASTILLAQVVCTAAVINLVLKLDEMVQQPMSNQTPMTPTDKTRPSLRKWVIAFVLGAFVCFLAPSGFFSGVADFLWGITGLRKYSGKDFSQIDLLGPKGVSINELWSDYAVDDVRAAQKWNGRIVSVSGAIASIRIRERSGNMDQIGLASPLQYTHGDPFVILCVMNDNQPLENHEFGRLVHITGRCNGIEQLTLGKRAVVLRDCRIVP
jgi:hypothetical protein